MTLSQVDFDDEFGGSDKYAIRSCRSSPFPPCNLFDYENSLEVHVTPSLFTDVSLLLKRAKMVVVVLKIVLVKKSHRLGQTVC